MHSWIRVFVSFTIDNYLVPQNIYIYIHTLILISGSMIIYLAKFSGYEYFEDNIRAIEFWTLKISSSIYMRILAEKKWRYLLLKLIIGQPVLRWLLDLQSSITERAGVVFIELRKRLCGYMFVRGRKSISMLVIKSLRTKIFFKRVWSNVTLPAHVMIWSTHRFDWSTNKINLKFTLLIFLEWLEYWIPKYLCSGYTIANTLFCEILWKGRNQVGKSIRSTRIYLFDMGDEFLLKKRRLTGLIH